MKVTALIPDDLVREVRQYAGGKNLTESLVMALKEWTSLRKIKELNKQTRKKPLQFADHFSAETVRSTNRNR
jgi:hypothetical protein